jgi:hypothetical protein
VFEFRIISLISDFKVVGADGVMRPAPDWQQNAMYEQCCLGLHRANYKSEFKLFNSVLSKWEIEAVLAVGKERNDSESEEGSESATGNDATGINEAATGNDESEEFETCPEEADENTDNTFANAFNNDNVSERRRHPGAVRKFDDDELRCGCGYDEAVKPIQTAARMFSLI